MRFKKAIAVTLVLCMSLAVFSACPTTIAQTTNLQIDQTEQITPEQAELLAITYPSTDDQNNPIPAKTNVANVAVKWAPVWTSTTFETLPSGKDIKIFHREYDYYYVEYVSNGITKRGYVPRSCTSTVVSTWCNHTIFNPGENITVSDQDVFYRPYSNSEVSGTIDTDEGYASNMPLIVLSRFGNYYYIQYVTNPDGGGAHMQWKRGWVPVNTISVSTPTSLSSIEGKTTFYIQNVGTGRFLTLEDPNAANNSDLIIQDFEGSARQKWTLEISDSSNSGARYVTIKTEAGTSSTDRIMAIENRLSVINTRMEIQNIGDPPGKHQEFYIKSSGYTSYGQTEYNICSRLTGNYMQLGVYHDQQGNGGPVLNKYPYTTWYNRWRLIPADARLVKLVCDTTCTKTNAEIELDFLNAVSAFKSQFGLDFKIFSVTRESFSTELPNCKNKNIELGCLPNCGSDSQCATIHHRGSQRLMGYPPTGYNTFKFVGHGLCNITTSHNDVDGTAYISHNCAIATDGTSDPYGTVDPYYNLPLIIQHELTHNLGAKDDECTTGSNCIMTNDTFNTWCEDCRKIIRNKIADYN